MPSFNTYCLTWVSLTLGVGYLFRAAPAKLSHCSLPWTRGISSPPPFLIQSGIAPLGPPVPVQPRLLGRGVGPLGHRPWPPTLGNSSWPPPSGMGVLPASAPDLGRGVAPLAWALARPLQPPALWRAPAAGRRYPTPLSPRPGAVAGRTEPKPCLRGHRRA